MISCDSALCLPVQMSLIFSVGSLVDIHPPCVLQSFVNHGAVLHKVFVVGERHFCVERPSLKNFPSGPCGWFATPSTVSRVLFCSLCSPWFFWSTIFCFVSLSFLFLLPPFLITLYCIIILLPFWCCNYIVIIFLPTDRETIFFNSQQVSKPESSSDLTAVSSTRGITQLHYKLVKLTRHGLLCVSKKKSP